MFTFKYRSSRRAYGNTGRGRNDAVWCERNYSEERTRSKVEGKSVECTVEELKDLKEVKLEAIEQNIEESVVENLVVDKKDGQ